MNSVLSYIIVSAFVILLMWAIGRIMAAQIEDDVIMVPRQIAVYEMDDHEAQHVYDWVVYVTNVMGRGYLEQLAFPDDAKHAAMLKDMIECLDANSHEQLIDWLKEVGYHHQLDVSIIDAPY